MRLACRFTAGLTLVAAVAAVAVTSARAQTLTWLGTLAGSGYTGTLPNESWAFAVSSDGRVVVGSTRDVDGGRVAFRWQSGTMSRTASHISESLGVSADGSVVVGKEFVGGSGGNIRAFRWKNGQKGFLFGHYSAATATSADGKVVVGEYQGALTSNGRRAFLWKDDNSYQFLGTLGGNYSVATAVSADGSVVVGISDNNAFSARAFRWTQSTGMQDIGVLPGQSFAYAQAVSADGSTVVGKSGNRAFRWTQSGGIQDLGTLGGWESDARGVSADGTVVVGSARNSQNRERAFRWKDGVMQDLNLVYAHLLGNGSSLLYAHAISPDARYIVGYGRNGATGNIEAYVLDTIPEPSSMVLMATGLAAVALRRRRKA